MKDRMLQIRRPESTATRPYDGELIPSAPPAGPLVGGLRFRGHDLLSPWIPDTIDQVPAKRADTSLPDLALLTRATHCNATFDGWIQIPTDGTWTFDLTTDSQAFVKIHSATLLDADAGYPSGSTVTTSIPLKAGLHPIHIAYSRTTGPAPALSLRWNGPGVTLQEIPASAFFSDDGDDDEDGLTKSQETAIGTSDYLSDTDEDGLSDATDFDPVNPNTAPTAAVLSNATIAENVTPPLLGDLSATQNDAGDQLTWSFASGTGDTDNAVFTLTGNQISLAAPADFETQPTYSVRLRATDLGGLFTEQTFTITITDDAVGLTATEWHQNKFGNAPINWTADEDNDGLTRLLEYAFGADPTTDSSAVLPAISRVGSAIRFTFTRRATGFHDLIYQIESSPSLSSWSPANGLTEVSVTPGPSPDLEKVVLEVTSPVPPGLFLRLKIRVM
jgi:hypothetical protein